MLQLLNSKIKQVPLRFNQLVPIKALVVEGHRSWLVAQTGYLEQLHHLGKLLDHASAACTEQTVLVDLESVVFTRTGQVQKVGHAGCLWRRLHSALFEACGFNGLLLHVVFVGLSHGVGLVGLMLKLSIPVPLATHQENILLILFVLVAECVLNSQKLEDGRHRYVVQHLLLFIAGYLTYQVIVHTLILVEVLHPVHVLALQSFELDLLLLLQQLQLVQSLINHFSHFVKRHTLDLHGFFELVVLVLEVFDLGDA